MENKGYIYIIENLNNNMKYVGQTNNPYLRWKKHLSIAKLKNYTYKSYLYSAMSKYGVDSFIFYIQEECELSIINERECFWIKELNTLIPNGYNILVGGLALYGKDNPFYGCKHTDFSKQQISNRNKGRKQSEEELKIRKEINSGARNPFYNKKHTVKTIERIKKSNRINGTYEKQSKKMLGNQYNKLRKYKKVNMISLNNFEIIRTFNNATEAGLYLKEEGLTNALHPSNIVTSVCNGHEKTGCGYFWKYVEEDVSTTEIK